MSSLVPRTGRFIRDRILLTRLFLPKMQWSARSVNLSVFFVVRHTPARVFLIFDIRNSPTADELRPVLVVVALVDCGVAVTTCLSELRCVPGLNLYGNRIKSGLETRPL